MKKLSYDIHVITFDLLVNQARYVGLRGLTFRQRTRAYHNEYCHASPDRSLKSIDMLAYIFITVMTGPSVRGQLVHT